MGDVTGSRRHPGQIVQTALAAIIATVNEKYSSHILSPLTITLGDEFQGVVDNLDSIVSLILNMESLGRSANLPFRLHYVGVIGDIDTDINPKIAHGMLGDGLSRARDLLTQKKRRAQFQIRSTDPFTDNTLNNGFSIAEGLTRRWSVADGIIVNAMLEEQSDQRLEGVLSRDRSSIYRRRKNLMVEEYRSTCNLMHALAKEFDHRSGANS